MSYTSLPSPTICIGSSCSSPWEDVNIDNDNLGVASLGQSIEAFTLEAETVAATTVTVTETTITITSTSITTIPAETKTEMGQITTATITPAPSTICDGTTSVTTYHNHETLCHGNANEYCLFDKSRHGHGYD
ncbi:hypothetical protein F5X99DRAFT_430255 [Biscogniauxia marginata]|nr:hypothetical protein F5X99DRAFT_430255 [Biscogniauxia marginata]